MLKRIALLSLFLIAAMAIPALASPIFDRGLPAENLNNAAGGNRSNVTWASVSPTGFTGDDFTIGTVGQSYLIDSITVWGAQYNPLSDDINNIWLYVGKSGSALDMLATGSVTGNVNSDPDITHTFVKYPDLAGTSVYVGNGGVEYSIAQTTFGGLNLLVDGGVTYNFGVRGDKYLWWNHASNAGLSGSTQDGADGYYLEFDTSDLSFVKKIDSNGNGWDKSSDINVQISGKQVPDPGSTLLLFGAGLFGLTAVRRRMKK